MLTYHAPTKQIITNHLTNLKKSKQLNPTFGLSQTFAGPLTQTQLAPRL